MDLIGWHRDGDDLAPNPLVPRKMAQVLADGLRVEIASGRLANGNRLPLEPELIARYGVSRAVVREALRLLESAGLIVVRRGPKGGAVVTHRTSGVVRDSLLLSLQLADARLGQIYDCLLAVLPGAARLAADRRPDDTAGALRRHVEAQRATVGDLRLFSEGTQTFNRVMLANCGNHALQLFATSLLDIMRSATAPAVSLIRHKVPSGQLAEGATAMVAYQMHLAEVMASGDGGHAEAAWRRYIQRVGEQFFTLVPRDLRLAIDPAGSFDPA